MTSFLSLPIDVILEIAEKLEADKSYKSAIGIHNLALSCRGLRDLLMFWTTRMTEIMPSIDKIKGKHISIPSCPLRLYCRRLAGLCDLCESRSPRASMNEVFTNLRLCEICEGVHAPKYSREWVKSRVIPRSEWEESFQQVEYKKCFGVDVCLQREINERTDLGRGRVVLLVGQGRTHRLHAEEYGVFGFDQMENVRLASIHQYWPPVISNYILFDLLRHWQGDTRTPESPSEYDLILLRDFRYRYDLSWDPPKSHKDELKEWARIASYWVGSIIVWRERPWCLSNLLIPPKYGESKNYNYVVRCIRYRKLFSIDPDILCKPLQWIASANPEGQDWVNEQERFLKGWLRNDEEPWDFALAKDYSGTFVVGGRELTTASRDEELSYFTRYERIKVRNDTVEIMTYQ